MSNQQINLDEKYWSDRYLKSQTGWDIGKSNPVILNYFKTKVHKTNRILIPGCGMSFEGYDLWKMGFDNIVLSDISNIARQKFFERFPDFPEDKYVIEDFFQLKSIFDIVVEQTFFCALEPRLRERYVEKMHSILNPNGKLIGVLFSVEMPAGPPFGGSKSEYERLFKSKFEILKLETAQNSVPQRNGREFFIEMKSK